MALKLAFIADKSEAFIAFQRDKIFKTWGVSSSDTQRVDRALYAGGASLFGDPPTAVLVLADTDSIKQAVEDIEALKAQGELEEQLLSGLLMTTTVARTSTKKLEKLVESLRGEVIFAKAEKGETVSSKLVNELKLNRSAKEFLISYVGTDYEAALPLIKTLSRLTPEQQYRVTEEDIYMRMPQAPGAVPPWELEGPLLKGDLSLTLDIYRRVAASSHLLVVLKVLNNKFQLAYRVAALQELNPRISQAELAEALGVPNNYGLKLAMGNGKKFGYSRMEKAVEVLAETEFRVKGGWAADPDATMELMLVRLGQLFSK